ncbi:MAG TPA: sortase [Patescibacteria group bacterium]|nr:sortase [Patescibacteria group bacterium]
MARFAAIIFLTIGCSFLALGLFLMWQRNDPNSLAFYGPDMVTLQTASASAQMPVRFSIPAARINLPVYPSVITEHTWADTKKGVSFLKTSPLPGEIGNSIIYGHNWNVLLGRLTTVKPGDKIFVTYPDSLKVFTVRFTATISPNETFILKPTTDRRITVYTCTGFLDSKRFVVTATLDEPKTLSTAN